MGGSVNTSTHPCKHTETQTQEILQTDSSCYIKKSAVTLSVTDLYQSHDIKINILLKFSEIIITQTKFGRQFSEHVNKWFLSSMWCWRLDGCYTEVTPLCHEGIFHLWVWSRMLWMDMMWLCGSHWYLENHCVRTATMVQRFKGAKREKEDKYNQIQCKNYNLWHFPRLEYTGMWAKCKVNLDFWKLEK